MVINPIKIYKLLKLHQQLRVALEEQIVTLKEANRCRQIQIEALKKLDVVNIQTIENLRAHIRELEFILTQQQNNIIKH